MPQRLRRVGTASAAASAGALVLVLAAPAQTAAAAEECKKGVDPETTIENWKCNLRNLQEALTPKSPTPTPTPKPTQSKAPQKTTAPSKPSKKSSSKTGKVQAKKPRRVAARPSGGQAPPPPSTMTAPGTVRTYSRPVPSATPDLPGVLPTPEIAADPGAYHQVNTVAMPQTRLISPAATAQDNSGQLLLVAAAAGVAGAVGALNLRVAARALRRRRTAP